MTFMETNRLRLRNVAVKDAEIMYDYRNNEICVRRRSFSSGGGIEGHGRDGGRNHGYAE